MREKLLLLLILFVSITFSQGQDTLSLRLDGAIRIAQGESVESLVAENRYLASYWNYRSYKAQLKPNLSLDAAVGDFNRVIQQNTQDDGSQVFISSSSLSNFAALRINQEIAPTGGSVFFTTSLQRLDVFEPQSSLSYLATPVQVGISQPIFGFNTLKWQRRIEPVRLEESKKLFVENREGISLTTVEYFFDLLVAQENHKIALRNLANNDTIFTISRGRYELGKIAENDLLQMELNLLNAQANVDATALEVSISQARLSQFLGINPTTYLKLIPPSFIPNVDLNVYDALEKARQSNSSMDNFTRRILESEQNLEQAQRQRFNIDLTASFGLNRTAPTVGEAYAGLTDQERVRLGINVPLVDWGKNKADIKVAESNLNLVSATIERERIEFEQQVFLEAQRFNLQQNQVVTAAKADTVANKSYEVAKKRYMIGKISITDLNIANEGKDVARRNYFLELRDFWRSFYLIRQLTHYDYVADQPIALPE